MPNSKVDLVTAAEILERAAEYLIKYPKGRYYFYYYMGACAAIDSTASLGPWRGGVGGYHYDLARKTFRRMFYRKTRSQYWWPRTAEYVEARALALLFAAAELRSQA